MKIILPLVILILLLGGYLVFSSIQPKSESQSANKSNNFTATDSPTTSSEPVKKTPSQKELKKLQDEVEKAFAGVQDEEIVAKLKMVEEEENNYSYLVEAFNLMKESYATYGNEADMDQKKHKNMHDSLEDLRDYAKKSFTVYKDSDFTVPD